MGDVRGRVGRAITHVPQIGISGTGCAVGDDDRIGQAATCLHHGERRCHRHWITDHDRDDGGIAEVAGRGIISDERDRIGSGINVAVLRTIGRGRAAVTEVPQHALVCTKRPEVDGQRRATGGGRSPDAHYNTAELEIDLENAHVPAYRLRRAECIRRGGETSAGTNTLVHHTLLVEPAGTTIHVVVQGPVIGAEQETGHVSFERRQVEPAGSQDSIGGKRWRYPERISADINVIAVVHQERDGLPIRTAQTTGYTDGTGCDQRGQRWVELAHVHRATRRIATARHDGDVAAHETIDMHITIRVGFNEERLVIADGAEVGASGHRGSVAGNVHNITIVLASLVSGLVRSC